MKDLSTYIPKSFEDLKQLVETGEIHIISNKKLCRTQESAYYFDLFRELVPENTKKELMAQPIEKFRKGKFSLLNKHFAYDRLLKEVLFVKHKVLWSASEATDLEIKTFLDAELEGVEYIYYENLKHNKSVPEIFHWQVFVNDPGIS